MVRNNEDMEEIKNILEGIAEHKYHRESWYHIDGKVKQQDSLEDLNERDWVVETNCGNFGKYFQFRDHFKLVQEDMIKERNEIDLQIRENIKTDGHISKIIKLMTQKF